MPQVVATPIQNKILAALPPEEYERLLGHLIPVALAQGETLYKTGDRIRYVYFANSGVRTSTTCKRAEASR